MADPGGYLLYPWIPPFWLAMYNRSVFSTEDHDLLRPPLALPAKWIQEAMEQLTYEYFERILSSNTTSNLEHAIFDRKWVSSVKMGMALKFVNPDTPFLQTWIHHCCLSVRYGRSPEVASTQVIGWRFEAQRSLDAFSWAEPDLNEKREVGCQAYTQFCSTRHWLLRNFSCLLCN